MWSLRNRLVLSFFGTTFIAFAALFAYISPGLQSRLERDHLRSLQQAATDDLGPVARSVGSAAPRSVVLGLVRRAALASGDRVTLVVVARTPGGPQASVLADSSESGTAASLAFPVFAAAVRSGRTATGAEETPQGRVGEAARPVPYQGRTGAVIVLSSSMSDIPGTVALVQREVVVAGSVSLIIAFALAVAVARALTARVKRLERAADRMAAGDFSEPVRVDSTDELGQLAIAFNDMRDQLSQLDSARKQFIATASHELRTPIFSLGGFVELLEDDDLDPDDRRRFLDQVRDQTERLRKLSVDLLDLSRLEAGSLELRPQPVDLGELARSVTGEFEPALAQHDAHLELRMSSRPMDAVCDPVRVAQIMRVLIDNALVHTPPGSRVVVTAARDDERLRISVGDDGSGIDPVAQSRIFEPFFTSDGTQGSGLGLAIAGELAGRMSGRLSVESRPGRTVFTFEMPVSS